MNDYIGPAAGDVGLAGAGDSEAGASGSDSGGIKLSQGGMIAIIVVIVVVCLFGSTSLSCSLPNHFPYLFDSLYQV